MISIFNFPLITEGKRLCHIIICNDDYMFIRLHVLNSYYSIFFANHTLRIYVVCSARTGGPRSRGFDGLALSSLEPAPPKPRPPSMAIAGPNPNSTMEKMSNRNTN